MRVCIDEARHDDSALGVDLDGVGSAIQFPPTLSPTRRDNDAVARRDPSALDRAHVARCRADARLLIAERREREKSSASNDEISLGHQSETAGSVANKH
jgi:hypothetical protein